MAVTTSADQQVLIYAKIIQDLIADYQYDDVTAIPFFRYASLVGLASTTASFPRNVKNAVAPVATETTSLVPTTLGRTAVDIAVARLGIAREITETVIEDTTLGRAIYVDELVKDAAILFGEAFDTDATAQFAAITATAGATGTALSIATMVAAMASQRTNKARGAQFFHLHDLQGKQLQQAQAAATSTPWATFYTPNADSTSFLGYFMGAPVMASSKNPTLNAGADRCGVIAAQGQSSPKTAAFAWVVKRMPSSLEQSDILMDAHVWASFARVGVGIPCNDFATKIVSQNQ